MGNDKWERWSSRPWKGAVYSLYLVARGCSYGQGAADRSRTAAEIAGCTKVRGGTAGGPLAECQLCSPAAAACCTGHCTLPGAAGTGILPEGLGRCGTRQRRAAAAHQGAQGQDQAGGRGSAGMAAGRPRAQLASSLAVGARPQHCEYLRRLLAHGLLPGLVPCCLNCPAALIAYKGSQRAPMIPLQVVGPPGSRLLCPCRPGSPTAPAFPPCAAQPAGRRG